MQYSARLIRECGKPRKGEAKEQFVARVDAYHLMHARRQQALEQAKRDAGLRPLVFEAAPGDFRDRDARAAVLYTGGDWDNIVFDRFFVFERVRHWVGCSAVRRMWGVHERLFDGPGCRYEDPLSELEIYNRIHKSIEAIVSAGRAANETVLLYVDDHFDAEQVCKVKQKYGC